MQSRERVSTEFPKAQGTDENEKAEIKGLTFCIRVFSIWFQKDKGVLEVISGRLCLFVVDQTFRKTGGAPCVRYLAIAAQTVIIHP